MQFSWALCSNCCFILFSFIFLTCFPYVGLWIIFNDFFFSSINSFSKPLFLLFYFIDLTWLYIVTCHGSWFHTKLILSSMTSHCLQDHECARALRKLNAVFMRVVSVSSSAIDSRPAPLDQHCLLCMLQCYMFYFYQTGINSGQCITMSELHQLFLYLRWQEIEMTGLFLGSSLHF